MLVMLMDTLLPTVVDGAEQLKSGAGVELLLDSSELLLATLLLEATLLELAVVEEDEPPLLPLQETSFHQYVLPASSLIH